LEEKEEKLDDDGGGAFLVTVTGGETAPLPTEGLFFTPTAPFLAL
jgi:hypothetical protein